ncbi:contractile injection system tape measure protein [Dinghuibacter silviterrae]|uniref:Uncharacterized protein n=1 Tax=Dinghuibacter silviterrae TaxID=1539049 RepID=A0A4R8DSN2_9BACT|nr:contractile injection system tape measure protein [Dinghuibacter silviterrae]TDX01274.1 hypothetical protein EDB95_2307 [Dinghuibacter silviterrae]
MSQPYVIQRYIWDIAYSSREKAYVLQTRFSRLFEQEAVPLMETVFEACIPPHQVLRLDTLELDLGILDVDHIERDFPDRFRVALERAILERLGAVAGAPSVSDPRQGPFGPDTLPPGANPGDPPRSAELLEYFLLEGILPWWASHQPEDAPQHLLERLYATAPGQLLPVLLRTGQLAYVRRRLAYQFPDPALHAVVSLLAPGEGPFISGYHDTLVRTQQETRWVPEETNPFSREIWLFILTFLLKDMAGQFNRRAFARQTLMDIAGHYNVSYSELLALFSNALAQTASRFQDQDALQKILRELILEDEGDEPETEATDTFRWDVLDLEAQLDWLRHYLLDLDQPPVMTASTRQLPAAPAATRPDKPLPVVLSTLFTRLPSSLRRTLADLGQATAVRERVVDSFGDAGLKIVVRLEEPTHAEFILDYATRIQTARRPQTGPGAFRRVVWTIILGYLWTEKGSVFNTRMFLERQLSGLASHYRLSYHALLSLLVGEHGAGAPPDLEGETAGWGVLEPSSLFRLLLDIWKESVQQSPGVPSSVAPGTTPAATSAAAAAALAGNTPTAASTEEGVPPLRDVAGLAEGKALTGESAGLAERGAQPGDTATSAKGDTQLPAGMPPAEGDTPASSAFFAPEAADLFRALLRLLQGLTPLEATLPGPGPTVADWERALPLLKGLAMEEKGPLPSWWDERPSSEGGHFLEEVLRWLSERTGLETRALVQGLAYGAMLGGAGEAPETTGARTLRFLLVAASPALSGPSAQSGTPQRWTPGIARLITTWMDSTQTRGVPDPRLETALQTWMGKRHPGWDRRTLAFMQDIRRLFLSVIRGTAERSAFDTLFLECALLFLGDRYGAKDPQTFAVALLSFLEARRRGGIPLYAALLKASAPPFAFSLDGAPFLPSFRALLRRRLPAGVEVSTEAQGGAETRDNEEKRRTAKADERANAAARARADRLEAQRRIAQELAEQRRQEEQRRKEEEKTRPKKKPALAGLYVRNAGLVLLHPLLPTLFQRLQWLEKGQFVHEEAQQRAVHLLQYLVYGQEMTKTEPVEQDLVLNKILCGLNLEDPVPLEVNLTEAETSLGEELLRVVLQQWTKLGKTSPDGLRVSFLQRDGSLAETQEAWTLRVEQRGIDVLLPFLPWGWGLIKTTWMHKNLHVEWT